MDLTGSRIHAWTIIAKDKVIRKCGTNVVYWKAKCKCGKIWSVSQSNLRSGKTKKCRDCVGWIDISGQKFGKWTAIEFVTPSSGKRKWLCRCSCGTEKLIRSSELLNNKTRKCLLCARKELSTNPPPKLKKGPPYQSYLTRVRNRARKTGIEFSLSESYVMNLIKDQNYLCSLTGELLHPPVHIGNKHINASLDRIDSSLGYVENNVQWVLTEVNKMKYTLSNKEFVSLCESIILNRNNKND